MPALKWLRLLLNHIPDKYEHLVRYYGHYSNRSRGARRQAEAQSDDHAQITLDDRPPDRRCEANWARLIQKVYEVDPLECPNCGAAMRIIALICVPPFCRGLLYPANVRKWPRAACGNADFLVL